jgi:hypothetical protein
VTKFRPVRELLSEAMAEVTTFRSWGDLIRLVKGRNPPVVKIELRTIEPLKAVYYTVGSEIKNTIELKPQGYDARIGWDSHLVVVNGMASGYTDGPINE